MRLSAPGLQAPVCLERAAVQAMALQASLLQDLGQCRKPERPISVALKDLAKHHQDAESNKRQDARMRISTSRRTYTYQSKLDVQFRPLLCRASAGLMINYRWHDLCKLSVYAKSGSLTGTDGRPAS